VWCRLCSSHLSALHITHTLTFPGHQQELDSLAADNPDRFHVWYVLEEPQQYSSSSQPAAAAAATAAATGGTSGSARAPGGGAAAAMGAALGGAARWKFSEGWVTPDMLAQHLLPPRPVVLPAPAAPSSDAAAAAAVATDDAAVSLALMCGPPGMLENVVVPSLAALGYRPEQMVVF
jgi:hypothetical protein